MSGEPPFDLRGKRVWVAGHRGMVGSALVRRLASEDCTLLTAGRDVCDLMRQDQVEAWLAHEKPEVAIIAAAKQSGFKVPLVVRLEGTNVVPARKLLDKAKKKLPTLTTATDLSLSLFSS